MEESGIREVGVGFTAAARRGTLQYQAALLSMVPWLGPRRPISKFARSVLKFVLTIAQILTGLYLAGELIRQNKDVDMFLGSLERSYGRFNRQLEESSVRSGLSQLARLYALFAILAFVAFLLVGRLQAVRVQTWAIWAFTTCTLGWLSIGWCTDHRKTLAQFRPGLALALIFPVILVSTDLLTGESFTRRFCEPIYMLLSDNPWHFELPQLASPIAFGSLLMALLLGTFASYYILIWLVAAPIAFASVLVIWVPVSLARLIHTFAPKTPMAGLVAVVFAMASLWLLVA